MALSVVALLLHGCEYWENWDDVFKKRYFGWRTSDDGTSVKISDGNRLLMLFGDSYVHADVNSATNTWSLIGGNTIGIFPIQPTPSAPPWHDDITFPANTSVRFYGWTEGSSSATAGRDITDNASGAIAFFRRSCTEGVGQPGTEGTQLWPADGFYWPGVYTGGTLAVFTWEVWPLAGLKQQQIHHYVLPQGGDPTTWQCQQVVTIPGHWSSPPDEEQLAADDDLYWGTAIVLNSTEWLIYGHRSKPAGMYLAGDPNYPDAVIAKVTNAQDVFSYNTGPAATDTLWYFYYDSGTNGCPSNSPCWKRIRPENPSDPADHTRRDQLRVVATDVANEFSVDRVTHTEEGPNGPYSATRWVMVHGSLGPSTQMVQLLDENGNDYTGTIQPWYWKYQIANFRNIVMRASSNSTKFPGPLHGQQATNGGTILGSTASADYIAKRFMGGGPYHDTGPADVNVVAYYNGVWIALGSRGYAASATLLTFAT